MKKFTSLLLTFTLLLFCYTADATAAKRKKPVSKNAVLALINKDRKSYNASARAKKDVQKKLTSYTYIDKNETTGQITDTSEKYVFTWADNGMPSEVIGTGLSDEFVDGKTVPYRIKFTNFVKANPGTENEFSWLVEDADFDFKTGFIEIYNNNQWQDFAKLEKTFSAQGNPQEMVVSMWLVGTWVNATKEIYTYDAKGNRTETIEQIWNLTKWENEERWIEFFDADGRNTGYQEDEWVDNAWFSNYGTRLTYTKNTGGQIVTGLMEQIDENGNWVNQSRQTYEWTGNQITKATEEGYDNGTWMNRSEYRNITWKSFDAMSEYWSYPVYVGGYNFTSYETYSYDNFGGSWNLNSRSTNIFTGDNITESINEFYNGQVWDTSNKTTYVYYPNGDLKEYRGMAKINDTWTTQYGYGNTNTYDTDGDITKSIGVQFDPQSNTFEESYIDLYTYTNVTVGIAKNNAKNTLVNVYPNPVSNGTLTISTGNNAAKAVVTVYDYSGKVVMQQAETAGNITLDVNTLPKGIYILNVNQAGTVSRAQFIIQ